jgi:kynureninase
LTSLFIDLVDEQVGDTVEVVSPRVAGRRGAQVSLRHPAAYPVMQALIDRGVVGDHRPPDLMRFGFAPLHTRWADVWDGVGTLRDVLESGVWKQDRYAAHNDVP